MDVYPSGTGSRAYCPETGERSKIAVRMAAGIDPDWVELSDADLIGRAAAGEARALEVLYERYSRVVYSFAVRILRDPQMAEELLQEVFFRAWQQGGSYSASRGTFVTWLLSITHNMAIDEIRKRGRRPQKADSEDPEAVLAAVADRGPAVEDEVWLGALRETINDALDQLPANQREAIELAYFRGLTQREIAEHLGEPLGTIKTRMRLGIRKLRESLEGHEGELV